MSINKRQLELLATIQMVIITYLTEQDNDFQAHLVAGILANADHLNDFTDYLFAPERENDKDLHENVSRTELDEVKTFIMELNDRRKR